MTDRISQKVAEYFNTAAFANVCPDPVNGPFSFSHTGRDFVIGPGLQDWDFGISRRFHLGGGESTWLQFRAEFFNLFNHPNLGQPDNYAGDPGFGTIAYIASDAREVQFGLKLNF